MRFDDLGLSPEVLRAVAGAGYIEPTPIQIKAIPIALQGRDIMGCAQTGTGKTAAFTLPMIDILADGVAKARMPRSLIVTPTRELTTQIAENFTIYGQHHRLTMALLIGGVSIAEQEKLLDPGVDVLIATPGRFLDLFERGKILLTGVKILVIDEADRMLDMGFMPDVEKIVSLLPPLRQTLFFSATMAGEIRRLANTFLHNAKEVRVDPPSSPAETVNHGLVMVTPRTKGKVLRQLLGGAFVTNALIFCNRKRDVDLLYRSLRRYGFESAALHGDMSQPARTEALDAFKRGDVRFLVATDVAGRGLDIYGLSHVFNYDVPIHAEDYVNRIGRTGRAGHRGRAVTLAVADDAKFLAAIARLIGREIPRLDIARVQTVEGGEAERKAGREGSAAEEQAAPEKTAPEKTAPASRRERPAKTAAAPRQKMPERTAPAPRQRKPERTAPAPRQKKPEPPPAGKKGHPAKPKKEAGEKTVVVGMGDRTPAFLLRRGHQTGK